MQSQQRKSNWGSPPLTWRTLPKDQSWLDLNGITSTYVENASLSSFLQSLPKDHLHLRGEHHKRWWIWTIAVGSPPLTWRTPCVDSVCMHCTRITSTYVENTLLRVVASSSVKDHLHLRGEHPTVISWQVLWIGSPPLTWRTLKDPYNKAIL